MTSSLTRIINSAEAVHCSAQSESSSAHHHRSAPPSPRHHHHHHLILLMTTDHHHHLLIIIILHLIRSRGVSLRDGASPHHHSTSHPLPRGRSASRSAMEASPKRGTHSRQKKRIHFISSAEIRPISEQLNSELPKSHATRVVPLHCKYTPIPAHPNVILTLAAPPLVPAPNVN